MLLGRFPTHPDRTNGVCVNRRSAASFIYRHFAEILYFDGNFNRFKLFRYKLFQKLEPGKMSFWGKRSSYRFSLLVRVNFC